MAVKIRMKKMGRKHRPFFRVCAVDSRAPRDGRVIEELGTYDPMIPETDARAVLKGERINYWLGVGAQPSQKVAVLIRKYGIEGTHLSEQQAAIERIGGRKAKSIEAALAAAKAAPKPKVEETPPPAAEAAAATEEGAAEATAAADAPAEEAAKPEAEAAKPEAEAAAKEEKPAEKEEAPAKEEAAAEAKEEAPAEKAAEEKSE